jgi:two-component system, OmpR family, response regulator MprA
MGERGRVLVVDDEELIRESLEAALDDEGYTVRTAADGIQALAVLAGWRPDVILLDLMMPEMDGPAFRRAQVERALHSEVPVIVLSGARGMHDCAERIGAVLAIAKPFGLDDVLAAVARCLTRQGGPTGHKPM